MFNIDKIKNNFKHTLDDKLKFGKYKGDTIREITEIDTGYIIFCYNNGLLKPDDELLEQINKTISDRSEEKVKTELHNIAEEVWNGLFD